MKLFRTLTATVVAMVVATGLAYAQAKKLSQDEVKALTVKAAEYIAAKGIEDAEKPSPRKAISSSARSTSTSST